MKEFWIYTGLRLLLFLASFAVVLGIWSLLTDSVTQSDLLVVLVIAFLGSGIGSYFVLNPQREAFARRVQSRAERAAAKFEESKGRED